MKEYLLIVFSVFMLIACQSNQQPVVTPWGTTLTEDADTVEATGNFSLPDIIKNGELIMLTISGPETYYDYHDHGMGLQYLLCEKFAQKLGVSLRVEVCKDTAEMVKRLAKGDGDVIAFPLPKTTKGDLQFCGAGIDSLQVQWAVKKDNKELADTLNNWFRPDMIAAVKSEESFMLSSRSVIRHVYSPMLNRSKGVISEYDRYFQMYAPMARMDWRMMAAQCYQESCFDPKARSWAGALGLMQIMPGTAAHLGLPISQIHNPEDNIAASARYMAELGGLFNDIADPGQRCWFVLASYNGGYHHIRDAMALARREGRNAHNWGEVAEFVLKLREARFYNAPIVKYGYMRGNETVDYVDRIRNRWAEYRGVAKGGGIGLSSFHGMTPQRAKRKNKFKL